MTREEEARFIRNGTFAICALLLTGLCFRDGCGRFADVPVQTPPQKVVVVERDTVRDTVRVPLPVAVETVRTDTVRVLLPVAAREEMPSPRDSVEAEVTVVRRHYADSAYEAWVSGPAIGGMTPALDSLRIYTATERVTREVRIREPPSPWGLSVGAGLTAGRYGVAPGLFVGVTYTIPLRRHRKSE